MKNLITKTKSHIEQMYDASSAKKLLFHNWKFKSNQISKAEELLKESKLNDTERETVLLTILFLDLFLIKDTAASDDEIMARSYLQENSCPEDKIKAVEKAIGSINKRDEPENEIDEIIRDVRYSFISDKNYPMLAELWREETQLLENREISLKQWRKEQLNFFRLSHKYYTTYANENWISRKKKNLKKLVKEKKKGKKLATKEKLKAKYKSQIPDRGIQTLYRVTLRNHIKLSDIADTKANILLSVNAIIISLALANLIPKLDNPSNDYLFYPTFIFIIFSIISMIMSILATRPNVTSGEFTEGDVSLKKVNLLFFGNFHKMELSKYQWAMKELIKDKDYIYSSLTKDLYYLGVVLEKKYKILRWTYTVFMIGMILSVVAFGIALKYFGPERVLDLPDLPQ